MSAVTRPFTFRQTRGRALLATSLVLWLGVTVLLIRHFGGLALDDFFVTYRYASNLAQGHGFVYNPGERVLGLTNPGLGLLLAGLYLVTGFDIPWLATALFGLCLLAATGLLLREGLAGKSGSAAFFGGTMVLISSYVWICHGGAAPLVLLLLVAAASFARRAPAWSGAFAGLAVWCRPDALLGIAILAALLLIERKRPPWIYALTAFSTVALGTLWAYRYFGTVLPVTLESKQLLAQLSPNNPGGGAFWATAAPLWKRHGGVLAMEIATLGLAGQYFVLRHGGRGARLLSLYGMGLAVAYPLLGVPFFNWYTVPTAVALLYGAAYFAIHAGRALGRWIGEANGGPWIGRSGDGPRIGLAVSAVLVTLMLFSFGERNLHSFRNHAWHPRMELYRQAAQWIRENSAPTDDVSALEIGVVGYYSRRPLEDLLGMVTPRALPFLARGNVRGVFQDKPTEFLLRNHNSGRFQGLFRSRWFRRNYRLVRTFSDLDETHFVRVYRRQASSVRRPSPAPELAAGP